jgi:FtsH-binding integral membrane protein
MQGVFGHMALALLITGIMAFLTVNTSVLFSMMYNIREGAVVGLSGFGWLISIMPIVLSFTLSIRINAMNINTARMVFWAYSVVMGMSLSSILLAYTGASVAKVFFITASVFAAMAIYGYSTKRDLTSIGSFLIMGLFGMMFASLVNIFLHSHAMDFAISLVSVIIFTGLTAYDVQSLKEFYNYRAHAGNEVMAKVSLIGALSLYLDFINIFITLLRFFGTRDDR